MAQMQQKMEESKAPAAVAKIIRQIGTSTEGEIALRQLVDSIGVAHCKFCGGPGHNVK